MLEEFLNEIKLEIEDLKNGNFLYPTKWRGHLSPSNISVSGYKGILKRIQIKDAHVPNATITINIDSTGNKVIDLATMYNFTNTTPTGAGAGVYPGVIDSLSNGIFTNAALDTAVMTLHLNLAFQSSCVVNIANASGFCIFWDEEI